MLIISCNKEDPEDENKLIILSQVPVDIPETSGLANFQDDHFLTISDSLSVVYLINSDGEIIKTLDYVGDDTEGIAFDPTNNEIFIVEEKTNEIVQLDTTGFEVNRFAVELDNLLTKHGLEGITYNPTNNHLYAVSEKYPSLLFELSKEGDLIQSSEMRFAEDYSSVYYDAFLDVLWILSDDSETLSKTTLEGSLIISYSTGIKKAEGVVVDSENSRIYIITDFNSSLFTLTF